MDLAHHDLPVRVTCDCGHQAKLEPNALLRRFIREGWNGRLHLVGDHLKCSRCGAKRPRVG